MSRSCVKCIEGSAIIVVGTNGHFCKECFEKYFTHKFRASLGKNPIVRHGERVAVALSGGNNSSALLRVLIESLSPSAFKRLKFHPGIIFVDETSILPPDDYSEQLSSVDTIMKETGFPYNTIKLEEVFNLTNLGQDEETSSAVDFKGTEKLLSLFNAVKTITGKEELLYRMRCKLLGYKAKELGYHHVFLGETSSRLAVNILSNIAQGRGAHIPFDTGFSDQARYAGIDLLRPLRDITSKEIAVYNAIHKVPTVFFPTFSTKLSATASIQRLTEDFIVSLSANFPATETTVYRTSNKLQTSKMMKSNSVSGDSGLPERCSFCHGPLDTTVNKNKANALNAIGFTESLSTGEFGVPDSSLLPTYLSNQDLDGSESIEGSLHKCDIDERNCKTESNLCHACRILYNDMKKDKDCSATEQMFSSVLIKENKKLSQDEMKKELEGLLIDS